MKLKNCVLFLFVILSGMNSAFCGEPTYNTAGNVANVPKIDSELLGSWKFDKITCISGAPVNPAIGTYTVNFQFYPSEMIYTGTSTYTGKNCHSFYLPMNYQTTIVSNLKKFQTLPPAGETQVLVNSYCPSTSTSENFYFTPEALVYEITGNELRIIRSPVTKPNRFCAIGDQVIEHLVRE